MNRVLMDTGRAVAFLSRLPVPARFFEGETRSISTSAGAYPLAGAVVALPASAVLAALLMGGVPPLFASALGLCVLVMTTGALHEDGLADCSDGFGGGRTTQHALDIMKDSTIGTYGGIALALSILLRVSGLAAITEAASPLAVGLAVTGIAAISRAAMVWHWHRLPAARAGGVARGAGQPGALVTWLAVSSGAILGMMLLAPAVGVVGGLVSLMLMAFACTGFSGLVRRRIGGHTGDSIGATQQICEIAALLGLALSL